MSTVENAEKISPQEDLKTVQLLAKGLLEIYEAPLVSLNTHLKELTDKQEAINTMMCSERRRLEDLQNDAMLDALLADIALNKEKLTSISSSMMSLHKRVQALQYCLDIMNLTPVQSGSKCGSSDFSIKRILSEDKIHEEIPHAPKWLCCTRYQPPRLPRTTNACRARRSGRHARVPFTGAQAAALEAAYSRSPYLAPPALRALASALQLRDDRIKIWFQNRRARERREKTGTITPPKAVALPSTAQRNILPNEIWVPNHSQTQYNFEFINTDNKRTDRDTLHTKDVYSSFSTSDDESNESSLDIETIID